MHSYAGTGLYAYVGGDPVSLRDSSGNCGSYNFTMGFIDSLSLGIGPYIRGLYDIDGGVDPNSNYYTAGELASLLAGLGRLGYAVTAQALSRIPGIAAREAVENRNILKAGFRGGMLSEVGMADYATMRALNTDAEIIRKAGRTNERVNAIGANSAMGGSGVMGKGSSAGAPSSCE